MSTWIFSILLAVAVVESGCSKSPASASAANKAFSTADAETKAIWDQAMAASQTNGYVHSILLFRSLRGRPNLTDEQRGSMESMLGQVTQRMFDAANKGDANAEKALQDYQRLSTR